MNHVLCPECFAKAPGEEKCCCHGLALGRCFDCGRQRVEVDPPWHCLGTAASNGRGPLCPTCNGTGTVKCRATVFDQFGVESTTTFDSPCFSCHADVRSGSDT